MAGSNPKFLVESALLTHGLTSIGESELARFWDAPEAMIAYVDAGEICLSGLEAFLPFRVRHKTLIRIDCDELAGAVSNKQSGALTASGTMAVCASMGVPLTVTGGMGGIGKIATEAMCPDLPALCKLPVALLATAPKDMLDYAATFAYLRNNDVQVLGISGNVCDGFMFVSDNPEKLDGMYKGQPLQEKMLLLNGLARSHRLDDNALLQAAIEAGIAAEASGAYYHPAVNQKLDALSQGKTSMWQLESLLNNIHIADKITNKGRG